jgi:hypothetical protein
LPGDAKYDRQEGKAFRQDVVYVLGGCGIVVLVVILTFVVYAILLVKSGWNGR